MSSLIGVLLDVSGSMKSSIGDAPNEEEGTWARSIFRVIDDIVKHDVACDNHIFAIGFGASHGAGIIDILNTVQQFQHDGLSAESVNIPATPYHIGSILDILERNGARFVRKWANIDVIQEAATDYMATLILNKLQVDGHFARIFATEYLPPACRDWKAPPRVPDFLNFLTVGAQWVVSSAATQFVQATKDDIDEVIKKAMAYLLKTVNYQSILSVHDASNILHGCVDERDLTVERSKVLLKIIEPFIYGGTPLYETIEKASDLFIRSRHQYSNHKKLLFILSDGMPADNSKRDFALRKLTQADVKVVSAFISRTSSIEPRRLYSIEQYDWENGAKCLFGLSSAVPTQLLPRAIFIKRGWKIEISNNETKLFMHVNHPDNMQDACDLARNVVCCQDALSDLLATVSLDIYINQSTESERAHQQEGGTCYANASAVVLHLAMKRILGREGGYPDFGELRQELIGRFGENGANTFNVLRSVCPKYRLRCQKVTPKEAMHAISSKRLVVARFHLTESEWDIFSAFFCRNPRDVLSKRHIDIGKRERDAETSGHAVVLVSYNSECLLLMNSWGENWADNGFFRVENANVLGLEFIDVYWTLNDLTQREKDFYNAHGSEVAEKLIKSLRSLQVATYTCPLCSESSLVSAFRGTLSQAICPKCNRQFSSADGEGNILALNVYLTSISR